jgi:cell division protein FtsI (penicillin-binding protein 3)
MIYIWLEKPTSERWASIVAAPVFRQVAEQVVVLMDIPPDDVRLSMSSIKE